MINTYRDTIVNYVIDWRGKTLPTRGKTVVVIPHTPVELPQVPDKTKNWVLGWDSQTQNARWVHAIV